MHFDVLNPNIVVSCANLTAYLRNSAIFDFLHSGELDAAPGITRVSKVVIGQSLQHIGVLRGPMLHMSSTHQMQQIHPNDLTLICPYVGVIGVGVRCSLSETRLEQAKKTQPVNGNGQFRKNMVPDPPLTHTSLKSPSQGLSEYTPHTPTFGTLSGHK